VLEDLYIHWVYILWKFFQIRDFVIFCATDTSVLLMSLLPTSIIWFTNNHNEVFKIILCCLHELYLLFVTKSLIRMRKYFLVTNDLLLIMLKLSWNGTITWTEWKDGIFNLILRAGSFMLKMARMFESKFKRTKFQEQNQKTGKKKPFRFLSEVSFIGWIVDPAKNREGGVSIYTY